MNPRFSKNRGNDDSSFFQANILVSMNPRFSKNRGPAWTKGKANEYWSQ